MSDEICLDIVKSAGKSNKSYFLKQTKIQKILEFSKAFKLDKIIVTKI